MADPTELRRQLTSGLDSLPPEQAHQVFSERLDTFLEANGIEEADIISGRSDLTPVLGEAAFNGLDFRGMEGTGLSLADTYRMLNDPDYRLEMAEKHLTGDEIERIEDEYSERQFDWRSPIDSLQPTLQDPEGIELRDQAVRTREFMHYELRDALNAGEGGYPDSYQDFQQDLEYREWAQMPPSQAAFHQNGGAQDLKYIHPDGRELVFDGDTGQLITDDRFMGTYNYVNSTIHPDPTPSPYEMWRNTQTEGSRLHKDYDVDPWVELGNTRADRYANGGEEARAQQLNDAIWDGAASSTGNTAREVRDGVSDGIERTRDGVGDAVDGVNETFQDLRDNLPRMPWQEGALAPELQPGGGEETQHASMATPGMMSYTDAVIRLADDQTTLNASGANAETLPMRQAVNHPDALEMFETLHANGVEWIPAHITPDMDAGDRVREILLAGEAATREAGIPLPEEQREIDAGRQIEIAHQPDFTDSYEDDYSLEA